MIKITKEHLLDSDRKRGMWVNAGWGVPLMVLMLSGCGQHDGMRLKGRGHRSLPVQGVEVKVRDMPVTTTAVGAVASIHTVTVRPQITGMLSQVDVHSGQSVKPGQVLFRIDSRPFKAALYQAEAKLHGDQAQQRYTADQVVALRPLVAKDYVTRQSFQQAQAAAVAAASQVTQDRYAVDSARIELAYTTVRSPISGRLGILAIKAGNVVQANSSLLATINQMNPVEVDFSIPQSMLAITRKALSENRPDNVELFHEDDQGTPLGKGRLSFIDNNVAAGSGTVALKALVDNAHEHLWPGQFVVVRLTLQTLHKAKVIPAQSVLQGQQGPYVYVVNSGQAQIRKIQLAFIENRLAVISSGLKPGETVIDPVPAKMRPNAPVHLIQRPVGADKGRLAHLSGHFAGEPAHRQDGLTP